MGRFFSVTGPGIPLPRALAAAALGAVAASATQDLGGDFLAVYSDGEADLAQCEGIETNKGLYTSNLKKIRSSSPEDCCAACVELLACEAYVVDAVNVCYLKATWQSPVDAENSLVGRPKRTTTSTSLTSTTTTVSTSTLTTTKTTTTTMTNATWIPASADCAKACHRHFGIWPHGEDSLTIPDVCVSTKDHSSKLPDDACGSSKHPSETSQTCTCLAAFLFGASFPLAEVAGLAALASCCFICVFLCWRRRHEAESGVRSEEEVETPAKSQTMESQIGPLMHTSNLEDRENLQMSMASTTASTLGNNFRSAVSLQDSRVSQASSASTQQNKFRSTMSLQDSRYSLATSSVEERNDDIHDAISRNDTTRLYSTGGMTLGNAVKALFPLGSAITAGLQYCQDRAHNDEEAAKAKSRLTTIAIAFDRIQEVLRKSPSVQTRCQTALAELERSVLRVSDLLALRDDDRRVKNLGPTLWKTKFDMAIEDIERARNDLMLLLNIEAVESTIGGRSGLGGRSAPRDEIDSEELRIEREPLGQGVYGKVYRATWQGEVVAVKCIVAGSQDDREYQKKEKSLIQELDIMVQLRSPRIIRVFGLCTAREGELQLVMEYAPCGSLRSYLDRLREAVDDTVAQRLLHDTVLGLRYLHRAGIVHGDLKSPNLLLDQGVRAKVADFGLSTQLATSSTHATQAGGIHGSLAWLPPENFDNCRVSSSSDIYAFGIVMWEVHTRQIPWENESFATLVMKVCVKSERPPLPEDDSWQFRPLMERCWAQQAQERPSVHEISEALASDEDLSTLTPPVTPPRTPRG